MISLSVPRLFFVSFSFPRLAAVSLSLALLGSVAIHDVCADSQTKFERKPGLWEVTVVNSGQPKQLSLRQCSDSSTDAQMMQMSNSQMGECRSTKMLKTSSGYEFASECAFRTSKITTRGTLRGDFNAQYTGDVLTTMEPPLFGQAQSSSKISARWVGPCPSGLNPGDIQMPDGSKIDMTQAAQGAKAAAAVFNNPEAVKKVQGALSEAAKAQGGH
jgi:hypothetical protein